MLSIRLQRTGKKHQPQFRVILAEKQKHPTKKFLEILGSYNPRNKEFNIRDKERVQYWIGQNVELSPTVHNLFVTHDILSGASKVKTWSAKPKEGGESESSPAAPAAPAADKAEVAPEAPAEETADSTAEDPKE